MLHLGPLLALTHLVHCHSNFAHGTNDSFQVFVHQVYGVERAAKELAHGDKLLYLEARDRLLHRIQLDYAVGFPIVANHGRNNEVADVFEGLYVVCLGVEQRLSHLFKVVVVDCLGLAKGGAGESLVARDANHVVRVHYHTSHVHVKLKLVCHQLNPLLLLSDHLFVVFRLGTYLGDFILHHIDQILVCILVVFVLCVRNGVELIATAILK